jgi:Fe2+ transport system protein FeoA
VSASYFQYFSEAGRTPTMATQTAGNDIESKALKAAASQKTAAGAELFPMLGPKTLALSTMKPGVHAHINGFVRGPSDPEVCYLRCLGFTPGAHVELIRRVSRGALAVYRVDDADVALRQNTAALVQVVLESEHDAGHAAGVQR